MTHDSDRVDGWKAIGAHFGRDRTTAIRWARDRGLPVRSLPGGKTRTVYAFRSELDAWAGRQDAAADAPSPAPAAPATPAAPAAKPRVRWRSAGLALGFLALFAVSGSRVTYPGRFAPSLPADPATAALYLRGNDAWARRDAASLAAAVRDLSAVTRRAPDFAPGHAALANAQLLMREFGSESEAVGHDRAEAEARRALALDPDLPAAWRALGFVAYWARADRPLAARAFGKALRLDPTDADTQFWAADILTDNGEFAAAERHYVAARLRAPGSLPIRTEQAWAHWSKGDPGAEDELRAIAREHPDHAVVHECLSMTRLAAGDLRGHLAELKERARLRRAPDFARYVDGLDAALRHDGEAGLRAALLRSAHNGWVSGDAALSALFLGVLGSRADLLRLLTAADTRGETWGWAGYRRVLAERWRGDPVILTLLARRAPPAMATTIDAD